MNKHIIVCVKQVPDTTEVRLDPVTGTLMREGVPSVVNPDDKAAIEAALCLKAFYGEGARVTALSMGPPQADVALREALAMGCDEAVLMSDRVFGGADTWATSLTLSLYIKKLAGAFDVVITGRQAIDGDTAQVGPQLAEHLGIPQVSYAQEIVPNADGKRLTVKQMMEDGYHLVEVETPCLLTALSSMNKPRYMSVGGIFDAYKKDVRVVTYEDVRDMADVSELGLKGSPTRVAKSFTKPVKPGGELISAGPEEAVSLIIERLREKNLLGV